MLITQIETPQNIEGEDFYYWSYAPNIWPKRRGCMS